MTAIMMRFTRYTDLVLAGGIVSIIALLIVPLPSEVLSFLQVLNLGIALTVLLVAIYTREHQIGIAREAHHYRCHDSLPQARIEHESHEIPRRSRTWGWRLPLVRSMSLTAS